jgi:3-isopropylmalate/(R)-2-methylmalate dehydratase small subunit
MEFCLWCCREKTIESLFKENQDTNGYKLNVNLPDQTITKPNGEKISFEVNEFRKYCLLNGLDDVGLTLQHEGKISAYEKIHPVFAVKPN